MVWSDLMVSLDQIIKLQAADLTGAPLEKAKVLLTDAAARIFVITEGVFISSWVL